ncbi:MAG: multidrug effflux MFS transporter [Rhodospirillales bacterium]|nr:multidrug effflux MFS transporter [Rhodospirillales bacterium]MDE2457812.1 multidrug effflux MFS transporter [Rhodospirillales bacterium]
MPRLATPRLPILLGLLIAVGPVSTDMYLPAFPALALALHNQAAPQYSLASYFLGLAIGQMVSGPLSDRVGRRGPLLCGLGLYILASLGAAASWNTVSFVVFRFFTALGASAAIVIPRAVVRDLADGPAAARLMSKLMLAMGLAPICAPLLGAVCAATVGWRFIFVVCTIYGIVALILAHIYLPDTLPYERRVRAGAISAFVRYAEIFRERAFLSHAIINACVAACLFAYLSGTPQIFEGIFHWSSTAYAVLFGVNSCAYIGYSQLNPILVNRFGVAPVISAFTVWQLLCTLLLVGLSIHPSGGLALAGGLLLCEAAFGLLLPCCMVGALSRHQAHAGAAAALLGTMQYAGGAVAGLGVGVLADGTARPMAMMMFGSAAIAALAATCRPRLTFELME